MFKLNFQIKKSKQSKFFDDIFTSDQLFAESKLNLYQIKQQSDERKIMNTNIYYGKQTRPDSYYQTKYHGFIKYQGETVRISQSFGCFFTFNSVDSLPETFKVEFKISF